MVGDIFLGTTTPSGLKAFFTNNFTNYTPISSPTIGWSKQHPIVGKFFFSFALPPLMDLEHFLEIISQIILKFHPQPLDARNSIQWLGTLFLFPLPPLLDLEHWMLKTASNGWGHFFGTTTHSGLRAFFTNNFTNYTPISSPTIVPASFTPTSNGFVEGKSLLVEYGFYFFLTFPSGPPWNEGHRPRVCHETSVLEVLAPGTTRPLLLFKFY